MKTYMNTWKNLSEDDLKNKPLPDWFKNGESADLTFEQIHEVYKYGYNVMICHTYDGDGEAMSLMIDTRSFTR